MSFFDRVDAVGIEGEMTFDQLHRRVRRLIRPYGVLGMISAEGNTEIGAVSLIGAVGGVFRALKKRHVHVPAGHVVNGRIAPLAVSDGVPRIGP